MKITRAALAALCLLAAPACADPISGYVKADGTPLIVSSLYTVTHTRRGLYKITFTTPFETLASCVFTYAGNGSIGNIGRISEKANSCTVKFPSDFDFSFIAVPMSN